MPLSPVPLLSSGPLSFGECSAVSASFQTHFPVLVLFSQLFFLRPESRSSLFPVHPHSLCVCLCLLLRLRSVPSLTRSLPSHDPFPRPSALLWQQQHACAEAQARDDGQAGSDLFHYLA